MRKERKEYLLGCFPALPAEIEQQMQGKKSANFVVLLTNGNELFARCYHRYSKSELIERQRYVFAKDGAVRYGKDDGRRWTIRSEFREPVFCQSTYGYNFDNSYIVLNIEAIKNSCMRYSCAESYRKSLLMEYMKLYCKHPNVEYLMKSGYYGLIYETITGYWGGRTELSVSSLINWKSNNLLKMLDLNRTEFKTLKGSERYYESYIHWRRNYPNYKPDELLYLAKVFGGKAGTVERFCRNTGSRAVRIAKYLGENNINKHDYSDYLDQCRILKYNLHDTAICMPYDFHAMHTRLSALIRYESDEINRKLFTENYAERRALEYSGNGLILRQPESMEEIAAEGAALNHCVGGYAERHAKGKLTILFLRRSDKPDVPYYTMEVSTDGRIVQCRGYKNNKANNPKPQEIIDFEKEYQIYLDKLFGRKIKNQHSRKSA